MSRDFGFFVCLVFLFLFLYVDALRARHPDVLWTSSTDSRATEQTSAAATPADQPPNAGSADRANIFCRERSSFFTRLTLEPRRIAEKFEEFSLIVIVRARIQSRLSNWHRFCLWDFFCNKNEGTWKYLFGNFVITSSFYKKKIENKQNQRHWKFSKNITLPFLRKKPAIFSFL